MLDDVSDLRRRPGLSPDQGSGLSLRGRADLSASSSSHAPPTEGEARDLVFSAFGSAVRRGAWEPPARLRVVSLFGGATIDYCEAEMLEGESVLEVFVAFGGVTVRVPADIDVTTEGIGIFGGFGHKQQHADPAMDPPRLRIRGLALFGGVEVKGPRKKSWIGRRRR